MAKSHKQNLPQQNYKVKKNNGHFSYYSASPSERAEYDKVHDDYMNKCLEKTPNRAQACLTKADMHANAHMIGK